MNKFDTYSRIARYYDFLDAPFERFRYQALRRMMFAGLGGALLDAGIGTGCNIPFGAVPDSRFLGLSWYLCARAGSADINKTV
jgi:hypothetical protein